MTTPRKSFSLRRILAKIRPLHRAGYLALIVLIAVVFWQPLLTTVGVSQVKVETRTHQTSATTGWKNVAIGGGGYVTGIYLHPKEANLAYIRTDNGGFFRWNSQDQSWIPLSDKFPPSQLNYYGGEALAVDPNNADLVYIAAGKYVSAGPGALFKSTNRGATWVQSNLNVPMGGDEQMRWAGNRLVVNPFDSNLLLFGSRRNGLWRSTDAGMTWTQVTNLPATPDPNIGILAIAFDPKVSGKVYLGAHGDGIYQSSDAGITWSKMVGSPVQAMKLNVAPDSTLYVTSAISPGVSKYVNNTWQDITPPDAPNSLYDGLSVHPTNPNQLLVSLGATGDTKIFYSQDGGATWVNKQSTTNSTVPWFPPDFFSNHASAIEFDPQVPNRVWLTDWFAIWRTDDITANPASWTNYEKGHEQTVVFSVVSPPTGPLLLSGIADIDGFYHQKLDSYPSQRMGSENPGEYFGDTYSIAYCALKPNYLVRLVGKQWKSTYTGATSTDGGLTWKLFPTFPANALAQRVAVSATNPQKFVVTVSEGQPWQTSDGGASWQPVSGLPNGLTGPWNWTQPLAADGVNGDKFYYYANGTVYRSDDGGLSFNPVNTGLPKADWHSIKTMPGVEGDVWVSLDDQGLYRSKDGGNTFAKISSVTTANLFAFGKAPDGSPFPFLYVYGTLTQGGAGIFSSATAGKRWSNITQPDTPIGTKPTFLEGSKQQVGLVFIGTNGRGIYYQNVA